MSKSIWIFQTDKKTKTNCLLFHLDNAPEKKPTGEPCPALADNFNSVFCIL